MASSPAAVAAVSPPLPAQPAPRVDGIRWLPNEQDWHELFRRSAESKQRAAALRALALSMCTQIAADSC